MTTHASPLLTADELASIRRDYRGASLLPKRAYHDAATFGEPAAYLGRPLHHARREGADRADEGVGPREARDNRISR